MKKILIICSLFLSVHSIKAQSLEEISKLMNDQKLLPAKAAVDKYLENPKNANNSDGWYYKARIYNAISKDAATAPADAFAYKQIAFDALKMNQQLDKLDFRLKGEFYVTYLDLYLGYYNLAGKEFGDKHFVSAYNSFVKAEEIENFILSKNYVYDEIKMNKLDTALVKNIAAAAIQAADTVSAVKNYNRIVEANIAGAENEDIYTFLASYYNLKNDDAKLQSLLAKAKVAYPANSFWNDLEIDKISKSGNKDAMFAKYEESMLKDPTNFATGYNYAVELYNASYGKDVTNPNPAYLEKLTQVINATIPNDKAIDATMLMANHLFNYAAYYSAKASLIKEGKPAKPELVKEKKELNDKATVKMDQAIPYAEKVIAYYQPMTNLTVKQKVNYQQAVGYLSDIYGVKGNTKKVAEYDKIRDSIKF